MSALSYHLDPLRELGAEEVIDLNEVSGRSVPGALLTGSRCGG